MEEKIIKRKRIVLSVFTPIITFVVGTFLAFSPIIFWGKRSDVISLFEPEVMDELIRDISLLLNNAEEVIIYYIAMAASLLLGIGLIFVIRCTCYTIVLSEDRVYGKNGYKKIDIFYTDITNLTQKGKSLVIHTKGKKIKIPAIKNYDEIYDFIKPRASMTVLNIDNNTTKIHNIVERVSTVLDKERTETDDIKLF